MKGAGDMMHEIQCTACIANPFCYRGEYVKRDSLMASAHGKLWRPLKLLWQIARFEPQSLLATVRNSYIQNGLLMHSICEGSERQAQTTLRLMLQNTAMIT